MGGDSATKKEYDTYKDIYPITLNEEFQGYPTMSPPTQGNKILKYQDFLDLITVAELAEFRCYINCSGDCPADVCPDCQCDAECNVDWDCGDVCEWDCPDVYCDPYMGF